MCCGEPPENSLWIVAHPLASLLLLRVYDRCWRAVQVSVLLDAGAGNSWKYVEKSTGQTFSRSEGLGVRTCLAFCRVADVWRLCASAAMAVGAL